MKTEKEDIRKRVGNRVSVKVSVDFVSCGVDDCSANWLVMQSQIKTRERLAFVRKIPPKNANLKAVPCDMPSMN